MAKASELRHEVSDTPRHGWHHVDGAGRVGLHQSGQHELASDLFHHDGLDHELGAQQRFGRHHDAIADAGKWGCGSAPAASVSRRSRMYSRRSGRLAAASPPSNGVRSAIATRAPASPRPVAIARPIPRDAPVTIAICPDKSTRQPALVALPVPRPYSQHGKITSYAIDDSLPEAVSASQLIVMTTPARSPILRARARRDRGPP